MPDGKYLRSKHELLPLFKKGDAPHINNIELGKRGRWRSNVWTYPGASSVGSDARRGLRDHPTVKPTAMLDDALLDVHEPWGYRYRPISSALVQASSPPRTRVGSAAASSSIRSTSL